MSAAQSPSLIHQYSVAYTALQEGKKQLFGFGVDRVMLNRYIVDSAVSTSKIDPAPVLSTIDPDEVSEGDSSEERMEYCRGKLSDLVTMQEEVNTLHKVAREKGIDATILTIVGQASVQSPKDHGASVIGQLNQLLNNSDAPGPSADTQSSPSASADDVSVDLENISAPKTSLSENAANDAATLDHERSTSLQKLAATVLEHKYALLVDVTVCFLASCFAIKLVS